MGASGIGGRPKVHGEPVGWDDGQDLGVAVLLYQAQSQAYCHVPELRSRDCRGTAVALISLNEWS